MKIYKNQKRIYGIEEDIKDGKIFIPKEGILYSYITWRYTLTGRLIIKQKVVQ